MDPQTNPYLNNNQNQQSSGRGIGVPRSIGRRIFGGGTKWVARAAFTAARFAFMWIIQSIVPLIVILFTTIATFLITLFAAD